MCKSPKANQHHSSERKLGSTLCWYSANCCSMSFPWGKHSTIFKQCWFSSYDTVQICIPRKMKCFTVVRDKHPLRANTKNIPQGERKVQINNGKQPGVSIFCLFFHSLECSVAKELLTQMLYAGSARPPARRSDYLREFTTIGILKEKKKVESSGLKRQPDSMQAISTLPLTRWFLKLMDHQAEVGSN